MTTNDPMTLSRRRLLALAPASLVATMLPASAAAEFGSNISMYFDANLATHTNTTTSLTSQGFRPLSVAIYGTATAPLFAAVWVKRSGPTWILRSNQTLAQCTAFLTDSIALGRTITVLSATGSGTDPRFVIVAENPPSTGASVLAKVGLRRGTTTDGTSLDYWLAQARALSFIPRSLVTYGTAASPYFGLVLESNPQNVAWNADGLDETLHDFEKRLEANWHHDGVAGSVGVSQAVRYTSIFRGDCVDGNLIVRPGLTLSQLNTEIATLQAQGMYPMQIAAGGSNVSTRRFAATFVERENKALRSVRISPSSHVHAGIDALVLATMDRYKIRQGSIAIVKDQKLAYARGYTNAESYYSDAQGYTCYRMASCTKFLTAILIVQLVMEWQVSIDATIHSVLGLTRPNGSAPSSAFKAITLRQLLTHTSGLFNANGDPRPAAAYFGGALPLSKANYGKYIAEKGVTGTPGVRSYSNQGFVLLGMVAEKITGKSFLDLVVDRIFRPLGLYSARLAVALPEEQIWNEARYDAKELPIGPSVVGPSVPSDDIRWLPYVYGADFDPRIFDSTGGLSMSCVDLVKVVASLNVRTGNPVLSPAAIDWMLAEGLGFDAWSYAPPSSQAEKGGGLVGLSSLLRYVQNGASIVMAFGKSDVDCVTLANDIAMVAGSLPAGDLFPEFGIPSF